MLAMCICIGIAVVCSHVGFAMYGWSKAKKADAEAFEDFEKAMMISKMRCIKNEIPDSL